MVKFINIAGLLLLSTVSALSDTESLGIRFENGKQDVPLLSLDYATYRGSYNESYDVCDGTVSISDQYYYGEALSIRRSSFSRTFVSLHHQPVSYDGQSRPLPQS